MRVLIYFCFVFEFVNSDRLCRGHISPADQGETTNQTERGRSYLYNTYARSVNYEYSIALLLPDSCGVRRLTVIYLDTECVF